MRNGYHFQGRQQARKLPNGHEAEVVTRSTRLHGLCPEFWIKDDLNRQSEYYWRASLVPAAAVTPAPIAYAIAAAAKTLVVGIYKIRTPCLPGRCQGRPVLWVRSRLLETWGAMDLFHVPPSSRLMTWRLSRGMHGVRVSEPQRNFGVFGHSR